MITGKDIEFIINFFIYLYYMSGKIKTKLVSVGKSGKKKTLKETDPSIKLGSCKFPFFHKGKMYDECYEGPYGKWCATKVKKDTRQVLKWAFCDLEENKSKESKPSNINVLKVSKASKAPNESKESASNTLKASKVPNESKESKVSKESKPSNTNTVKVLKKSNTLKKNVVNKPKKLVVKSTKKKFKIKRKNSINNVIDDDLSNQLVAKINKKYLIPPVSRLTPDIYELPNRKSFPKWVFNTYRPYKASKDSMKVVKSSSWEFFNHQKFVRDYLNKHSPYRGLLLFHGLGVGKTCASIAIAEAFRGDRQIVVLLNKSLKQNFKVNLMKCGFEMFRINQHWVYHKFIEDDPLQEYANKLKMPKKDGAWFVDFTKSPNYESLSSEDQENINFQVNYMIDRRYKFYHLDGLNGKKLEKMNSSGAFDNKLLIVDEVHNLTNAMSKQFPGVRGRMLKQLIMNAKNLKMVFLSGTPMINNLFETAQLFNLLRGFINLFTVTLNKKMSSVSHEKLIDNLKTHELVDQVLPELKNSKIHITRTPYGFINNNNRGVSKDVKGTMSDSEFMMILQQELLKQGYESKFDINSYTCFPDNEDEFMSLFYDQDNNRIKNPLLFQSRILGLVSFFRTQDKGLLPTVTVNEVVPMTMSKYQFIKYSAIRNMEIEQDKNKNKSKPKSKKSKSKSKKNDDDVFDDKKSSYRAYSRMHCSFVFPESIERPYPGDLNQEEIEDILDIQDDPEKIEEDDLSQDKKMLIKKYEAAKEIALKKLDRTKNTHFTVDVEDQLVKYSPKYNQILKKIMPLNGTAFIYTEYKTLEGIAILQIVLKANGFAPFILSKNSSDEYIQIFESEDDIDKPKYAFWGGNEEESDIIRKVYNNDFEELPKSLKTQLEKSGKNNLRGDIVKVLLTTKTGAEGIDLHNVRQVHVVEPYWNPVRIKQVMGRAVRVNSHKQLPKEDQTVEIYRYVSVISPEDLKTDKTIQNDFDGKTSDQVLFDISSKKLEIMDDLLRLIKGASVDCNINLEETREKSDEFKCINYGTNVGRDLYSFIPNVKKEHVDTEKERRVVKKAWKPVFIKIPGAKLDSYVIKRGTDNEPSIIYDPSNYKQGGDALGEIKKDGKKMKIKEYTPGSIF